MIKKLSLSTALAVATVGMGAFTQAAEALTIIGPLRQNQTVAGQDFVFNFSDVPPSDGMDATLTVRARGDYFDEASNEFIDIDIEGLFSITGIGSTASGPGIYTDSITTLNPPVLDPNPTVRNFGNDHEFEKFFIIPGATFDSIIADGLITINVNLSDGVNSGVGDNDYVELAIGYTPSVPEPSTFVALVIVGGSLLLSKRVKWG